MAIAAQGLSRLHSGLFQQESDETDSTDETNQGGALLDYEEADFGLIFQHSLSIDLSQVCVFREIVNDNNVLLSPTPVSGFDGIPEQNFQNVKNEKADEIETSAQMTKDKSNNSSFTTKVEVESGDEIAIKDTVTNTESENIEATASSSCATVTDKKNEDNITMATVTMKLHKHHSSSSRKKRPSRQERQERKEKKYKRVDLSDFGFHFLCKYRSNVLCDEISEGASDEASSPSKDETSSEKVYDCDESESQENCKTSEDSISSVAMDEKRVESVSECENSKMENDDATSQDDEAYFADLGIDVTDCGSYYDDDFLDWDGLVFTPPTKPRNSYYSSSSKRNTKSDICKNGKPLENKSKNDTAVLIDTAHEFTSLPNYSMHLYEQTQLLNLECNSSSARVHLRKDKHRKIEKLHKACKTTHCTLENIINYRGSRKFYMHHRLLKKINFNIDFRFMHRYQIPPMPKAGIDVTVAKAIRVKTSKAHDPHKRAPAQNLRHILHETNIPNAIQLDLAGFLLSIQNRDLTPEDYEMLLRLDDTVEAKTVSKNVLDNLRSETVGSEIADIGLNCVICMEPYSVGQVRKFLPCDHDFHSECINSWLANNSQNCPLDGLPIADT